MKLKAFYASDGDCLLLTSADGHHVLVDGGRVASFDKVTQPVLQDLAKAGSAIDLVVVSHIDADHISGVISLLSDVAAWVVHDFQVQEAGNPDFPVPARPRPPQIRGLWHNSWRAQVGDLAGPIEALAQNVAQAVELAPPGGTGRSGAGRRAVESAAGLAESISDGVRLLQLVDDQTPIPRNAGFGKLVLLRQPVHTEQIGAMTLAVLGPAEKHLERLRDDWRDWLDRQVRSARIPGAGGTRSADGASAAERLGGLEQRLADSAPTSIAEADALVDSIATAAEIIETVDSTKVTPPNRASITLLAEEAGRTCLLTGDAAEEELLEGLTAAGRLAGGRFRCDVLKVQHHGSEFNLSRKFAESVIADDYVFSADGAHGNPDPSVVKTIVETRLDAGGPFRIWFTCSPARTLPERRKALDAAIREARQAAERHPDAVTVTVLGDDQPFLEIEV